MGLNLSSKKFIYILVWITAICSIYYTNLLNSLTMDQLKFFLLIFGIVLFRKHLIKEIKGDKQLKVITVSIFAAIFILLISYVYQWLLFDNVSLGTSTNLFQVSNLLDVLILAPLFEELTYRYAMIHVMKDNKILSYISVIISTVLFSYSHRFVVNGNILLLVPYLVMGLTLGILYLKKQNILYSLYTHFFYNLIIVLLAAFMNQ